MLKALFWFKRTYHFRVLIAACALAACNSAFSYLHEIVHWKPTEIKNLSDSLVLERQNYSQTLRIGMGYSLNTYRLDKSMQAYSDTSEHQFTVVSHSPIYTFSQQFVLDTTFSLGYTVGFSYSKIFLNSEKYGEQLFFALLEPQLKICQTYHFSWYCKLRAGVAYYRNESEKIPARELRTIYPGNFKVYTGFTPIGINYFISDKLSVSAEYSIWSTESFSIGVSYRFFNYRNASR